MNKKQPIIELKHIKKCYTNNVPVIYDFNLTINEGEFVTFLGPSGCGKSTFLKTLNRMNDYVKGIKNNNLKNVGGI